MLRMIHRGNFGGTCRAVAAKKKMRSELRDPSAHPVDARRSLRTQSAPAHEGHRRARTYATHHRPELRARRRRNGPRANLRGVARQGLLCCAARPPRTSFHRRARLLCLKPTGLCGPKGEHRAMCPNASVPLIARKLPLPSWHASTPSEHKRRLQVAVRARLALRTLEHDLSMRAPEAAVAIPLQLAMRAGPARNTTRTDLPMLAGRADQALLDKTPMATSLRAAWRAAGPELLRRPGLLAQGGAKLRLQASVCLPVLAVMRNATELRHAT